MVVHGAEQPCGAVAPGPVAGAPRLQLGLLVYAGPALVPWVGRVHDLPIEYMWLKFAEWAKTYGPLYRTQMLGSVFIIITDEKIAEDLLVKRGKIYGDRPQIRSLFDPKSTNGSMEYLPLMGKNGMHMLFL